MKATDFHISPTWQRRTVDLSSATGAAGWRAAQAFAHEGANVLLGDFTGRDRMVKLEQLCEQRGIEHLLLQRGSDLRGDIWAAHTPEAESLRAAEPVTLDLTSPHDDPESGNATLVGGGPGAPDLLTIGAMRAIAHADAIFVDRLGIALNVLDLAPAALVIDVGKAPGRHKLPQERINEEMYELAAAGANVVRLKGGDVFIFGRGGEEWRYLAERGVPVSVVPGITSALSVPAHAGISPTLRNVTRAVTIVSGHQPFNAAELRALVDVGSTIIILMGIGTFPGTVAGLREAGLPDSMEVALLERGFTPDERHTFTTLGNAVETMREREVTNPAIIVIGEVVAERQPRAFETRMTR